MGNHYHLLVETPRANLGEAMHRIIETIGRNEGATVATLAREWPEKNRVIYARSLLWLAKLALVRITRAG